MLSKELNQELHDQAARIAFEKGESCTAVSAGCLHRDCAAARVRYSRQLRLTGRQVSPNLADRLAQALRPPVV